MAMVLTAGNLENSSPTPKGWTQAARRPFSGRPPSFVTTETGSFIVQHYIIPATTTEATAAKVALRRKHDRRGLIIEGVLTALGLRSRRFPRSPEERLDVALSNVRSDLRDRAGH